MEKMKLYILFILLPYLHAYLCLLDPQQRGSISYISGPADMICYQVEKFCGTLPPEKPKVVLKGGSTIKIKFQQNLSHYNRKSPGFMDVSWAFTPNPTEEGEFYTWEGARIEDVDNNPTVVTNFTVTGIVPNVECKHAIIR